MPDGQHRRRRDLRAGPGRRRHRDEPDGVLDLGEVGDPLAWVEERQRELGDRELRALVEEPHRLGGIEHRAAAERDEQVGLERPEHRDAGADDRPRSAPAGPRRTRARRRRGSGAASSTTPRASVSESVTTRAWVLWSIRRLSSDARVEVRVRRDPEPLRRHLAVRDRLDVHQIAVVDVVGRQRAAPGAAAEREGRRHRVVDAAQRTHGRRGVDEDAAGADALGERVDHVVVRRVDRGGVPEPALLGHELGGRQRVLERRRAHERRAPASASRAPADARAARRGRSAAARAAPCPRAWPRSRPERRG